MWFRLNLIEDDESSFTDWVEETVRFGVGATAPTYVNQLRATHPNAAISIERSEVKPNALDAEGNENNVSHA